jgi:putative FmdB family regulatory protein
MPTYEYVCEKCGHEFDKFQPIADAPLKTCPRELCGQKKWGKGKVKRVIGAGAGLIFKGSGFYITDYRSDNYKAAAKKESAPSGGDAKPAAASDSKAAPAKTESKPAPKPAKKDAS